MHYSGKFGHNWAVLHKITIKIVHDALYTEILMNWKYLCCCYNEYGCYIFNNRRYRQTDKHVSTQTLFQMSTHITQKHIDIQKNPTNVQPYFTQNMHRNAKCTEIPKLQTGRYTK